MHTDLISRIRTHEAILGVVGLGYVGLPLAVQQALSGFKVIGYDVSETIVNGVNHGFSSLQDVSDDSLSTLVNTGGLVATSSAGDLGRCDCIFIAVPTPLDVHRQPDLSFVISAAESLIPHLHADQLVVLESTTYPGTTQDILVPILERSGLVVGRELYVAFSPERIDPGNRQFQTSNTPKVVGGVSLESTEVAASLYEEILEAPVHRVSKPAVAEMEKILENTYRNVNIALVNELAMLCDRMNIDIWEVIDAAATKPFGFQAFYPGPGVGGHCIPLDPGYLAWKAREYGFHTTLIENADRINEQMPDHCLTLIVRLLAKHTKSITNAHILVLGVAYKPDISDSRESAALTLMHLLRRAGAIVEYYDSFVPTVVDSNLELESITELSEQALSEADMVVITTAHSNVDYEFVARHAQVVFDTRNAMKMVLDRSRIETL